MTDDGVRIWGIRNPNELGRLPTHENADEQETDSARTSMSRTSGKSEVTRCPPTMENVVVLIKTLLRTDGPRDY